MFFGTVVFPRFIRIFNLLKSLKLFHYMGYFKHGNYSLKKANKRYGLKHKKFFVSWLIIWCRNSRDRITEIRSIKNLGSAIRLLHYPFHHNVT